jgi:lipoprotein-anchoring transpeptidase ErfK/SrfK
VVAESYLDVSIGEQRLCYFRQGRLTAEYPVSTAKNGYGQQRGSECTPLGWHRIRAKVGQGQPLFTVYKGRRPTGEIFDESLAAQYPMRDWILTRILWLDGLEPGVNRYGLVDTGSRYIYIHGAPDQSVGGAPDSHGCVRMKNRDVLELFDLVEVGVRVYIHQ